MKFNSNIFRHLKLEIALAILASNDEKLKQFSRIRVKIISITGMLVGRSIYIRIASYNAVCQII